MFHGSTKYVVELMKVSDSQCKKALMNLWSYMPDIKDHDELDAQIGLFKQGVKALLMKEV